jgi:predicted phosphodiesterase
MLPLGSLVLILGAGLVGRTLTSAGGASGPRGHWLFDPARVEGQQVQDLAGKLPAQLIGVPQFLSKPTAAVHLRKPAERVVLQERCAGDAPFLPREAVSIAAWVRLEGRQRWGGILGVMQHNGNFQRGFLLGCDDYQFYFALAAQKRAKLTYLSSNTDYALGRWYHVAATYDGRQMRIYVNGREDGVTQEQSGPILYAAQAPFVIGRYQDDNEDYPLQGAIKEVRLYDRALSRDEIAAQFATDEALAALPSTSPLVFIVAPYLQYATTDSMTIGWETSAAADTVIEYGPTVLHTQKTGCHHHAGPTALTLRGLNPQTQYVYRLTSTDARGESISTDWRSFLTAVPTDGPYSFAVIGDTQNNPKMTAQIGRLMWERRPHFVLHCGDVVEEGKEKRRWVDELFRPCADLFAQVPVYPTIGNHERNHANYYKYFYVPEPKYYYKYRYGNADFFSIDSNRPLLPGSEQYTWLDQELARSDARWKFVYHHHPAWSSDNDDYGDTSKGPGRAGDLNVRCLVPLYEKHNVDVVFNGHIHLYERSRPLRAGKVDRKKGVLYITSGGGGGALDNVGPVPLWFKAQVLVDFHYCYVTIDGGHLEFRAFDQRNMLFDSFDLER